MKPGRLNPFVVVAVFILNSIFTQALIFPQESGEDSYIETSDIGNDSVEEEKPPEVDKRKEILLYGIDNEVKTVLADLQREKLDTYNQLLQDVIKETRNSDIIQSIYRLWDETAYIDGLAIAREELTKVIEDEDFDSTTVQSAIAFIADQKDSESLSLLYQLSTERDTRLAAASIRAIGKIPAGTMSESENPLENEAKLLERMQKEDPIAEDDLVAALIVTLGDLRYLPAADELVGIVEDTGGSSGHRRLACISLGKIGRSEDFQIVERIYFEEEDATLRSYALAGLAEFPEQDTVDILIQALKRDSFWRIRVTAAEKISGKEGEGINELLRYKASNDPVTQVKIASLNTLGSTGDLDNSDYLLEYFKNNRNGTDVRLTALSVLVKNRITGTNEAINTVMDKLWDKDEGRFLEFVCRDLSRSEWPELAPIYKRMMTHTNWLFQIYAIRGIRRNEISSLEGDIKTLDRDGVDSRVRREITIGQ